MSKREDDNNGCDPYEGRLKQQHQDDFNAWWECCGLRDRVEKGVAREVWLAARGVHN
jgi:hypothetical protein